MWHSKSSTKEKFIVLNAYIKKKKISNQQLNLTA